ncbi:MAG: hypothetical protein HZB42_05245 [Sphingobacteriales bacterium]|nr:hypothetical protein [Sphingobacteriales bacterium]
MKLFNLVIQQKKRKNYLFLLAFILVIPLLSFNPDPSTTKSRYMAMVFDKTKIETYVNNANFSHFVFQQKFYDKNGARHLYKLIVYAYDNAGNIMNSGNIELLDIAKKGMNTYRDDEIINSNYLMKKSQYVAITNGKVFTKLKFNPVKDGDPHTYPNYITYEIFPVDDNENPVVLQKDFTDDNYLKPSPPAPPPSIK